jgi:hypothetical protein
LISPFLKNTGGTRMMRSNPAGKRIEGWLQKKWSPTFTDSLHSSFVIQHLTGLHD